LNKEWIQLWCLVWFAVNLQGEQEPLNHYRIIMNVTDQNDLQEMPQHPQGKFYGEEM
jgi:hypothetical protein